MNREDCYAIAGGLLRIAAAMYLIGFVMAAPAFILAGLVYWLWLH